MPSTITQKIIADHIGKEKVESDQFVEASVDLILSNDIMTPVIENIISSLSKKTLFNKDKVIIVSDHFVPNKDIKSAEMCKCTRNFAIKNNIKKFFDGGRTGIEHALLPEKGFVLPGDFVIGADSHTCTYGALGAFSTGVGATDAAIAMVTGRMWLKVPKSIKIILTGEKNEWVTGKDVILHIISLIGVFGANYRSLEFTGDGVECLSIDDRFTIANMVVESGAKNCIFPVDNVCKSYIKECSNKSYKEYEADKGAEYEKTIIIDLSKIEPLVAFPHLPDKVQIVERIEKTKIDQVVIGSCTNGRISDLRIAAQILKNQKIAKNIRTIIIPATQKIYLQAIEEGLISIFIKAGAIVSPPTCGPCLGGHMGVLASGEKALSTTNRNFVGRMGAADSEVYLSGPAVAAASAIKGYIISPQQL